MQNIKTIPQLAVQNLPADLESKADADEVVLLTGNQTVEGNKNLTETPVIQLWNADINPTANQTIVFSINSVGTFELYKNKTGINGSNPPAQDGTNWEFISTCQGSRAYVQEFAPSESPVSSITLTEGVCYNADFMTVAVDHTILDPSAYTLGINGTTITFVEPVEAGLTITVRWFTEMNLSNVYRQPLLSCFWSDHLIYELSYLCADPFSWQDGNVYSAAYNHLVADIEGKNILTEGLITYYQADDGHKIATAVSHDAVDNLYDETGVSWYYILDVENHRFKLPRTKYAFSGWRGDVGGYIPESLPNITGSSGDRSLNSVSGAFYEEEGTIGNYSSTTTANHVVKFDASLSSSTYQDGAAVQQRGTQMYLYFYVGNYTPQAIEQTAGYAQTLTELKADKDLANSPYTTNRILEIPQDIKLELNDGTPTLKAGSKVCVPNGFEEDGTTLKFDMVVIESDITIEPAANSSGKALVTVNYLGTAAAAWDVDICSTGTTDAGNNTVSYRTDTNFIIRTDSSGGKVNHCFPIALINMSGTTFVSIDQVFNGFGYIGSTVFALPGVKVQVPDGRNEDGTYKSDVITTNSVITRTITGNASDKWIMFNGSNVYLNSKTSEVFDADSNYWKYNGVKQTNVGCLGGAYFDGTKISSFTPYTVDSVANSNASNFSQAGRSYLSGLGMPSNRYIDLTLLASGSKYTAPANGWFYIVKASTAANQYISIAHSSTRQDVVWSATTQAQYLKSKCLKGETVNINYTVAGTTSTFRFIYAEGEN